MSDYAELLARLDSDPSWLSGDAAARIRTQAARIAELEVVPDFVIAAIIKDIRGRKGLGDEWDQIDVDVRNEIAHCWIEIVRQALQ